MHLSPQIPHALTKFADQVLMPPARLLRPTTSAAGIGASILAHPSAGVALSLTAVAQMSEIVADSCLTASAAELAGGSQPWAAAMGLAAAIAVPKIIAPLRNRAETSWQRWAEAQTTAWGRDAATPRATIQLVLTAGEAATLASAQACLAGAFLGAGRRGAAGIGVALCLVALAVGTQGATHPFVARILRAAAVTTKLAGSLSLALAMAPLARGALDGTPLANLSSLLPGACEGLGVLCPAIVVALLAPRVHHLASARQKVDPPPLRLPPR